MRFLTLFVFDFLHVFAQLFLPAQLQNVVEQMAKNALFDGRMQHLF